MGVGGPGVDFASLLVDFGAQKRLPARKMMDRGALPWLGRACTPPQPRQRVAEGLGRWANVGNARLPWRGAY